MAKNAYIWQQARVLLPSGHGERLSKVGKAAQKWGNFDSSLPHFSEFLTIPQKSRVLGGGPAP